MSNRANKSANGNGTIRKRSDGRWEGRYTTGIDPKTGKQIQKSIYGKSQKEVRQKLTEITSQIDTGTYIEPNQFTVQQWLEIWLQDYMGDKKYGTIRNYKVICEQHIIPHLGRYSLSSLKPYMIQSFYNQLYQGTDEKRLSPKTVKNVHGVLSKALNQAIRNELIRSNPASLAILPRAKRKDIQTLSDEQIQRFLTLVEQDSFCYILKFILMTGVRESEAIGLTWDCIDFERGTIRIYRQLLKRNKGEGGYIFTSLKNDKERQLTPAPTVLNLLKERKREQMQQRLSAGPAWACEDALGDHSNALVFTNEFGQHYCPQTVYAHFKKLAKQLGADKATVHSLRHTFAVLSLQNGDDVKTVQENLGHATASFTLDVYGHVSEKMKQDSADRMERYLQSLAVAK